MQQFDGIIGKSMLVSGLDSAGLLAIQAAIRWGASRVVGVDVSAKRIEYARSLGLGEIMHAGDLGEARFELGYDCAGSMLSVENVLEHVVEHIVVFDALQDDVVYRKEWWGKGKRLETYNARPFNERDCNLMIDLVVNKGVDMKCLFTHRIPFARYSEVVDTLINQGGVKVLFYPGIDFASSTCSTDVG